MSGLINTYGARFVGVTGSLLVAFGTLICAHAPNIYVLYISYGFINGEFQFIESRLQKRHQFSNIIIVKYTCPVNPINNIIWFVCD